MLNVSSFAAIKKGILKLICPSTPPPTPPASGGSHDKKTPNVASDDSTAYQDAVLEKKTEGKKARRKLEK